VSVIVQAFDNQLRQKQIEMPFELKKPIPLESGHFHPDAGVAHALYELIGSNIAELPANQICRLLCVGWQDQTERPPSSRAPYRTRTLQPGLRLVLTIRRHPL